MLQRESYFDNAKFILIILVVFGHLLQSYIHDSEIIYIVYKVIYTFHMPAFILVSGYFAKGFRKKGYMMKISKKIILPYLIFQLIYSVFYYYLYHQSELVVDPLTPHWSLWYLLSLFFWNIMLYPFAKLKGSISLFIALIIGLGIGYFDSFSEFLSLSRTFVYFPFFLLGYFLQKEHFTRLRKPAMKFVSFLIIVGVSTFFYFQTDFDYEWLLGRKSYHELNMLNHMAVFMRSGFYLLSFLMVFSFYAIVPRKRFFFTNLGRNTLYVYLLHGFIVRFFRASEVQDYIHSPTNYFMLVGFALLLTILLSSNLLTAFAQPIIELKLTRLKEFLVKTKVYVSFYKKKLTSH